MLTVDFREISLKAGMRLLDAGCGGGRHLCEAIGKTGVNCVGVDLNWEDLCKTKGVLSLMDPEQVDGWIIAIADVTKLPFSDSCFDVVICSEVLEHVADNKTAIAELVRVLKPLGDLVVTVPRFCRRGFAGRFPKPIIASRGGIFGSIRKGHYLTC